jgi:hypothetical protein
MKSNSQKNQKNQERPVKSGRPNEIPEKRASEHERSEYPRETEQQQQQSGSDASYRESHDVTPPNPHEFPSFGNAKTDFVSGGKHGRATGRMIDHEPGL